MKKKKKVWIALGAAALVPAAVIAVFVAVVQNNMDALGRETIPDVELAAVSDGVYSGSYSNFPISVKVAVTVQDHVITDIALIEHRHGQGAAAEAVPGIVTEAQSLDVDAVSGATYSSKAILKAISNALTAP